MHARVTRFSSTPEKIEEGIKLIKETIVPGAKKIAGFKGGYWLLDRKASKGFSVTLFESESALKASADAAAQLRARATSTGVQITGIEEYEVVAEAKVEELARA